MGFVKKFYIADTHFQHENVIHSCRRPFLTSEVMDEYIVARWNEVVGRDDIVFHLGDFSMRLGEGADRVRSLFQRLNGRKHLVLGNHDVDRRGRVHKTLSALDWAEPPSHMSFTSDAGMPVVLSHYAQRAWLHKERGAVHFYGHSHGNLPGVGRSRDVGVDMLDVDFTPRTFIELTKELPV